jgi:hypothetical protein
MTKQPRDDEIDPRGHLIHRGSALHRHRHHRTRPIAHDLDVQLAEAARGQSYDLAHQHHRKARVHQHGVELHDPALMAGIAKRPCDTHIGSVGVKRRGER